MSLCRNLGVSCFFGGSAVGPELSGRSWSSPFVVGSEFSNIRAAQRSWSLLSPSCPRNEQLCSDPTLLYKGRVRKPGLSLPHSTVFRELEL